MRILDHLSCLNPAPESLHDNDQAGEEMALRVMEQLPNQPVRKRPLATDWNEDLKNTFKLEHMRPGEPERKQSQELSL